MKAYLVFGDPRQAEKRVVLEAQVGNQDAVLRNSSVEVRVDGRLYEGGLLGHQTGEGGEGHNDGAYVSILVSESLPRPETLSSLQRDGWQLTSQLPRPQQLPFPVHTTLVLQQGEGRVAWSKTTWFPHAFAPSQRTLLDLAGETVSVSCLEMTLRRDGPHRATFVALSNSVDQRHLLTDGWQEVSELEAAWEDMIALSGAVEALVTYVLGATVVSGSIVHNTQVLEGLPYQRLLPTDVLEEVCFTLIEMGREDLVPESFRILPAGEG